MRPLAKNEKCGSLWQWVSACLLPWTTGCAVGASPALQLDGFADAQGAISVQHQGDTVDPYFALQALLLAHDNGLDIRQPAVAWIDWLVTKQKPDATFDRFCRNGPVWAACKTADADDALLALWIRLLDTQPGALQRQPELRRSRERSALALNHLLDPLRGVYLVSPVYQHALFMDNLEVLSALQEAPSKRQSKNAVSLAKNIQGVFWDAKDGRYLVSTQPEQKEEKHSFYPEHVAQIYPLMFDVPLAQSRHAPNRQARYTSWMAAHRATWLTQSRHDFSWGLIAIVALRLGDRATAACWLRESAPARRTVHWIVTDDVAEQILRAQGVEMADPSAHCG